MGRLFIIPKIWKVIQNSMVPVTTNQIISWPDIYLGPWFVIGLFHKHRKGMSPTTKRILFELKWISSKQRFYQLSIERIRHFTRIIFSRTDKTEAGFSWTSNSVQPVIQESICNICMCPFSNNCNWRRFLQNRSKGDTWNPKHGTFPEGSVSSHTGEIWEDNQ